MLYEVRHTTIYAYHSPVSFCHNLAHLLPRDTVRQTCLEASLQIDPLPTDQVERRDAFGNRMVYFTVQQSHQQQSVTMRCRVRVGRERSLFESQQSLPWEEVRDQLAVAPVLLEAVPFRFASPHVPLGNKLRGYALDSFTEGRPLLDAVDDLVHRIYQDFTYDPEFTTVATPLQDVLKHRRGVCQDFAHLGIGCLRSLGLAARYVSGYLETVPPPGQEKLVGADASHAWLSVYLPDGGWVDFDPTNDQRVDDRHITVATGRDFADVVPLRGVAFGGGEHTLDVAVDVKRIS